MPDIPSVPATFSNHPSSQPGTAVTFDIPSPSPGNRWVSGYVEVIHTTSGTSGFWQDQCYIGSSSPSGGFSFVFYGPDGFGYHNHLGTFDETVAISPSGWNNSTLPGSFLNYINSQSGTTVPAFFQTSISGFFSLTDSISSLILHLDEGSGPGGSNTGPNCPPCPECGTVYTGECANVCVSRTLIYNPGASAGHWVIDELPLHGFIASDTQPGGFTVTKNGDCTLNICAPCGQNAAGTVTHYRVTYWLGQTYTDPNDGHTYDVALSNCFDLIDKVLCQEEPPPPNPPSANGQQVSYDVSDARRHVRTFISSGKINLSVADNSFPLFWQDKETTLSADDCCIRYDRQSEDSALWLLLRNSSSISLKRTQDEGETFDMPMTVLSGSHPTFIITRDGRKHCFAVTDAGAGHKVIGKVLDALNNTMIDQFDAVASCDDDTIACDETVDSAGEWRISLIYRDSGAIKTVSSKDGKTFS